MDHANRILLREGSETEPFTDSSYAPFAKLFMFPSVRDSSGNVVPAAHLYCYGVEVALGATAGDLLPRPAQLKAMSRAVAAYVARQSLGAAGLRAYVPINVRVGWNTASPSAISAGRAAR